MKRFIYMMLLVVCMAPLATNAQNIRTDTSTTSSANVNSVQPNISQASTYNTSTNYKDPSSCGCSSNGNNLFNLFDDDYQDDSTYGD